jgi:hypothetical protein
MADQKLIVHILGDDKDLIRAFRNSTNASQKFKVGMGSIFKGAVGFLAVQKGATLAGDAIRAGIDEFTEATRVTAQTNAALKSTGGVANVTARQVQKLSGSLSRMSGIDDELVQQGENLLLTFKNVRNEVGKGNKIFDRATAAALDLSVAGFGSVETTAKQLGKALNDPVRGMTALRRSGITFSKAQEDVVNAMVKANDTLGAQRLILKEVESQVGGSARALGETLPGKLNILRNTFDNLAGSVVQRFEPAIKKAVDGVVVWLSKTKNQEKVQKAINDTVKTAATVVKVFVQVLETLRAILGPLIRLVGGLQNAIKLLIAVMVAAKVASFVTAIATIGTAAQASAAKTLLLRTALTRLALVSAIAIPITVFLNRKQITAEFNKLTDKLPSWAPKGSDVRVDKATLPELRKLREQMQGMSGDNKAAIALIDKQIAARMKALRLSKVGAAAVTTTGPAGIHDRPLPTRTTSSLGAPVVESHLTVKLDSDVVSRAVSRQQTKTARRNPRQKRGSGVGAN